MTHQIYITALLFYWCGATGIVIFNIDFLNQIPKKVACNRLPSYCRCFLTLKVPKTGTRSTVLTGDKRMNNQVSERTNKQTNNLLWMK